jgi:hypothetical protein
VDRDGEALGTAVFFGILFTPVFYVVVRWLTDRRKKVAG